MSSLRLRRPLGVVVLLGAALALAGSAAAARVPAGKTPATIVLPAGWTSTGASATARFGAKAPTGYGLLQVTSGGSFPMSLPFASFVTTEVDAARASYRAEDPKAVVSGKKVMFPSGPSVEITASVHHGAGTPLSIVIFSFLHRSVTYHFTFVTYQSSIGSLRKTFEASARTIRFK